MKNPSSDAAKIYEGFDALVVWAISFSDRKLHKTIFSLTHNPYTPCSYVKRRSLNRDYGFPGRIDDLCIYDRALSQKEIENLFADERVAQDRIEVHLKNGAVTGGLTMVGFQ